MVENHIVTREAMEFWLEAMGHVVQSVTSVQEAMAILPEANADVLISDISLPDGTGWDLMHDLQLPSPLYAIAMSGLGAPELESKSLAAGFRHHLTKPFDPDKLAAMLDEAQDERGRVKV